MQLALVLIVLGIATAALVNPTLGGLLVLAGIVCIFWPRRSSASSD